MKNAFAVSSLILTVGYSVAVAAEMIGVVSFHVPSFASFIGVYAAVGILTFAFGDYFRQTGSRSNSARRPAPRREIDPALHALSFTNSPFQAK